jgi:hypothetical protein
MNIADAIKRVNDVQTVRVETPEWGEVNHVYVRTVSLAERRRIYAPNPTEGPDAFIPRILTTVICDEQGNRLFTDEEAPILAEKSVKVLDRILAAWSKLIKVDDLAVIEKKS